MMYSFCYVVAMRESGLVFFFCLKQKYLPIETMCAVLREGGLPAYVCVWTTL